MSTFVEPSLILIGYRATGKTTLGRALAVELGRELADSDDLVEARAEKSIARIFAEDGEKRFRDMEEEEIEKRLRRSEGEKRPLVLSTGGGAILRSSTRERLKNNGRVFWLKADPETIHRRVHGDPTTASRRPGLTDLDVFEEILHVLRDRTPLYQQTAHFVIDTETKSVEELVKHILHVFHS